MKKILIIGGVSAAIVAIVAVVILSRSTPEPAPEILPSASPTASPTPELPYSDGHVHSDGEDLQSFDAKQREVASNPLLEQVPQYRDYWSLTFDGVQGNQYALVATVFYRSNENPQAKIDQQRPFILDFIRGTGQPDGTYTITYQAKPIGGPGD